MGSSIFEINLPAFFEKKTIANFKLDEKFFEFSDDFLIETYLFNVTVVIEKKNTFWQLDVILNGSLNTCCDRCGHALSLNLKGEEVYYVKQKSLGDDVDNVIFIEQSTNTLNIEGVLREVLFFLIPKRRIHEESQCDIKVLKKLDSYQKNKKSFFSEFFKDTKEKLKKT